MGGYLLQFSNEHEVDRPSPVLVVSSSASFLGIVLVDGVMSGEPGATNLGIGASPIFLTAFVIGGGILVEGGL